MIKRKVETIVFTTVQEFESFLELHSVVGWRLGDIVSMGGRELLVIWWQEVPTPERLPDGQVVEPPRGEKKKRKGGLFRR